VRLRRKRKWIFCVVGPDLDLMKLSIVTPTLNSATTLRATLESIRPLVEAGAEHIVVDSASSDQTVALAEAAGAHVIQHPRGNMYAAINAGLKLARGEWVTYINSDDLLYADAVTETLARSNPKAEVLYGNIDHIDEVGRFLFSWRSPEPRQLAWLMQHYCPFPQQGTLFRRELHERLGGFDTNFRFSADYEFFVRCIQAGVRFDKFRSRSIAGFRLLPSQLSQRLRTEMAPEGRRIRAALRAGQPGLNARLGRPCATLYRWSTNIDSVFLRAWRGRNQDAGWRT
jgi:glycosyltransferase involved in cell wall biosynthesis